MKQKNIFLEGLDSFTLHILAISFMILDHSWNVFFVNQNQIWMNLLGRLAFPIFAFMLVEGFYKTKNRSKYLKRIFIFAVISEIPFNLLVSTSVFGSPSIFFPYNNVLWTFGIALYMLVLFEKIKNKDNLPVTVKIFGKIIISILAMFITRLIVSDYREYGIMMVLVFYFFRSKKWWNFIAQVILLAWINIFLIWGYNVTLNCFGNEINVSSQSFAIFSLVFIWLYNGKQGIHNKITKYMFYSFYPLHLLLIVMIYIFLRNTSFIELNDISIVTKNGFNYKFIEIPNSKIGRKIGIEIFN